MTDTKPVEAAEATKKEEVEEVEASKAEDTRAEVAHLETSITNRIISNMTNMVHHQQSILISKDMLHPVIHHTSQMDLGMAIIIITETRPGLLNVFISALYPIGPSQSCLHLALRAEEYYTAEL